MDVELECPTRYWFAIKTRSIVRDLASVCFRSLVAGLGRSRQQSARQFPPIPARLGHYSELLGRCFQVALTPSPAGHMCQKILRRMASLTHSESFAMTEGEGM